MNFPLGIYCGLSFMARSSFLRNSSSSLQPYRHMARAVLYAGLTRDAGILIFIKRSVYMLIRFYASALAISLGVISFSIISTEKAQAQANILRECGSRYQAAKAANELGGLNWQEYLKACRARLAEQAKPVENSQAPAAAETQADQPKPDQLKPDQLKPAPAQSVTPQADTAKPTPVAPQESQAPVAEAKPVKNDKEAQKSRQKKCADEWKAKKKALLKENKKLTWPKFWSSCNQRLKDAGE